MLRWYLAPRSWLGLGSLRLCVGIERVAQELAELAMRLDARVGRVTTYIAINSIHHQIISIHHLVTRFSTTNFGRLVLGRIKTDFDDQILVGKRLTRSTDSTFFSGAEFCKMFTIFIKSSSKNSSKHLMNSFIISSFLVMNESSSAT